MSAGRYTILGLAPARTAWSSQLAHWATSGRMPIQVSLCVSATDLRLRLDEGRRWSAIVVDAATPDLDRDLLERARAVGAATLVVGADETRWHSLGAVAVLPRELDADALLAALAQHARTVHSDPLPPELDPTRPIDVAATGALIAVTGPGGAGSSTAAAALAQGFAARHSVVLADLALDADQAMLHDARDVIPGVPELVEGHRAGDPAPDAVAGLTFATTRGYRLLLGLRRPRDWTALPRRATEAALAGLRRAFDVVIADVTADVDGERETGSVDVEDRNLLARTALGAADVVVVVGRPNLQGVHRLVRTATTLVEFGLDPERLLPVFVASPRRPRARADASRAFGLLAAATPGAEAVLSPLHLGAFAVDTCFRDGTPLPGRLVDPLTAAADGLLGDATGRRAGTPLEPIRPGELGLPDDPDTAGGRAGGEAVA